MMFASELSGTHQHKYELIGFAESTVDEGRMITPALDNAQMQRIEYLEL